MSSRRAALFLLPWLCTTYGSCIPVTTRKPPDAAVARPLPACAASPRPTLKPAEVPPASGPRQLAAARYTLPGGATLYHEPDRLVRTVALTAFIATGAGDEPQPGTRHLLERLLMDGNTAAGAYAARLRAHGSQVVSFTAPDYTLYQIVTPAALFSSALELVQKLFDPASVDTVSEEALGKARQSVLGELVHSHGEGEALRRLFAATYASHPYQQPLLGTTDSLGQLSIEDLRTFYRRQYRLEHLTLVVVGNVSTDELTTQLASRLSKLPARAAVSEPPRGSPAFLPRPGPRVEVIAAEGGAATAHLGFAIPRASDTDVSALAALEVAATLLSTEAAAPPPASTRRCFLLAGHEPGMLVLTFSLPEAAALRSAAAAALRLGAHEVSTAELVGARQRLLASYFQRGETPAARAQRLGSLALINVEAKSYEAALHALTPALLRESLGRYLTANNLTLVLSAPRKQANVAELRTQLSEAALSVSRSAAKPAARVSSPSPRALLYRLRSGARLAMLPDEGQKAVAVAALWPGGQQLEDEHSAGLSELLAHAWPRRLQESTLEAKAGPDSFGLQAQLPSGELFRALPALREMITHPAFDDIDLERGRREILFPLGEKARGAGRKDKDVARIARRLFVRNLLGNHPYAWEPSESSLNALNGRRMRDFYRQHYVSSVLVLAVVGDFDPERLLLELEPWLGPAVEVPAFTPSPAVDKAAVNGNASTQSPRQTFELVAAQKAYLVLGYPVPSWRSPLRAPVEVLSEILVGEEGRLRQSLLQKRGLVDSIEGFLSPGILSGYLAFELAALPQKLDAAEATLHDELHKLSDSPPSEEEVSAARERLLAHHALLEQRITDRAWRLGQALLIGGSDPALDGVDADARLLKVDAAAVQAAARTVLREEQMVRTAAIPATSGPVFGILPEVPRLIPTRNPKNATNVVSRSAQPGNDRRDGARSKHFSNGRGSRPLSGRIQGVTRHVAALRREARH